MDRYKFRAEKDAQIAEKDAKIAELEQGGGGQSLEQVLEQVRDARAGSVRCAGFMGYFLDSSAVATGLPVLFQYFLEFLTNSPLL